MSVDEEKSQIQFYNLTIGRTYTLSYDGTTGMKNKFGDEMVAGQFASGDMVRVTFIKDQKAAKSLQLLDSVSGSLYDNFFFRLRSFGVCLTACKYTDTKPQNHRAF